jgi:TRAP-type C4-dicarboxylate transport system permease small subunit
METNNVKAKEQNGFLNNLNTSMTSLTRVLNIIGMVMLILMMILTVTDVFLRYAFRSPILGSIEITQFMMVLLSLGMGWALLKEKVIRMGLVVDRLSPRLQAIITSLTYILGSVILAMITWRTFQEVFVMKEYNSMSATLRIPTYPFYGILAFSLAILTLSAITLVIQNTVKAWKK